MEDFALKTKKMILTGLFIGIGVVLPQTLHLFGGSTLGTILLPMHLPVFIGAMLLGPVSGLIIAISSVLVGVMLGMPSILIASYMVFELSVYALVSGFLFHKKHLNVFVSYGIAKILGMGTAILVIQMMIHLFGVTFPPLFGSVYMFVVGVPGIILQIVIIPSTAILLKKEFPEYA
jgi:niacin transporter